MKIKTLILVALFAALTAVGAFIKISAPLAPITLQIMFTAFSGILLGPKYGALSQLVYLVIGLIGIPVFTEGGGFAYLLKPSFGFLAGMVLEAFVIGKLSEKLGRGTLKTALSCLAGFAALYIVGLPYMYVIFNVYLGKAMSVADTLWYGCVLFLPGDLLKIAAVSLVSPKLYPALHSWRAGQA